MPTRWFPEDNESLFSPTSLSSKEPGLAREKKVHNAHRCICSERKDEQMVMWRYLGRYAGYPVEHAKSDTHNQLSRVARRATGEEGFIMRHVS
jgi:hypothetical protein